MTTRLLLAVAGTFAAAIPSFPAIAGEALDVSNVVAKTCARSELVEGDLPAWAKPLQATRKIAVPVSGQRLAAFLQNDVGVLPGQESLQEWVAKEIDFASVASPAQLATLRGKRATNLANKLEFLQNELAADNIDELKAVGLDGKSISPTVRMNKFWLVSDAVRFACIYDAEEKPEPKVDPITKIAGKILLRETTEALALTGEDRKTAPSASIAYKRERSYLDDGTAKNTSTATVKAVLGFPFYGPHDDGSILGYAGYELNRARIHPAPVLTAPATERDGDTEILKFGLFANHIFSLGDSAVADVAVDAALLTDYVHDSQRLRLKLNVAPDFGADELGICAIGRLNSWKKNFLGLRGKCTFEIQGEVNHLTRKGTLTVKPEDEFVLAGGRAAADFQFGDDDDSGLIAGVDYRYLHAFNSAVPDIDRFKAYFKYRFWFGKLGVDTGFEFIDGTNPDSFADDNSIMLTFGLVL
jgi:hypothetical protein